VTALLLTGCTFFVVAMSFLASRNYRFTVARAAPCAVALGIWLVAPLWINTHYLAPASAGEWFIVGLFLVAVFASGGVLLAALLCWPLAIADLVRRQDARLQELGALTILSACLPFGFIGVGALIEWTGFGRTYQLRTLLKALEPTVVVVVPVVGVLAFSWIWAHTHRLRPDRTVRTLLVGGITLGLLVLPFRIHAAVDSIETAPLVRRDTSTRAPLLVIGLDGASWQILRPLMQSNRLPTFARLAAEGVQGEIVAPWPPYWSGPAWASIMTGHGKEVHGFHEQVSARVAGLPKFQIPLSVDLRQNPLAVIEGTLVLQRLMELEPFPRDLLKAAPIWERLHAAGARVGVIRFPFTHPAIGQAEHVISFRVVSESWDMLGVQPGAREFLVTSSYDRDRLLRWFAPEPKIDTRLFDGVLSRLDWPKPAGDFLDPSRTIGEQLTTAHQTFGAVQELLANDGRLDALIVYVSEFDKVSHALWPYRFPADYPPGRVSARDIEVLGPLFDRYVIDLDKHLGQMIQSFPRAPNVIILSDHGMEASREATIWHAWHSAKGMFLAAGPDIAHDDRWLSVSYSDVVPTFLELLGFHQPTDLTGQSVLEGAHASSPPLPAGLASE
jgi:hypothetical protein